MGSRRPGEHQRHPGQRPACRAGSTASAGRPDLDWQCAVQARSMITHWRGRELELLLYPVAMLCVGLIWLQARAGSPVNADHLLPALAFGLLMLLGHAWLCWRLPKSDQLLFPVV